MSKELAIVLAIVIIVLLLFVFFVSFVLYRRTPAPKGCEKLAPSEETCGSCKKAGCPIRWVAEPETEQKEEEQ